MSVRIIIDSACDMTQEEAADLGIDLLPLTVTFGEKSYRDSVDISHDQFFEKLIESDELPVTSQITPFAYRELFKAVCNAGDTAVCITLSSKLSGCWQSACMAAEEFSGRVQVVDSENACVGQRLLAELAARMRGAGHTAVEIAERLDKEKKRIRLIALLDTLEYLKRGGRISKTAAFAGGILSVKPVIAIENGTVAVLGRARGSKNGSNMLKERVSKEKIDFSMPYCLAYSGLSDTMLRKYIEDSNELYPCRPEDLPRSSIGAVIGTHIGPGAIAAAYFVMQ